MAGMTNLSRSGALEATAPLPKSFGKRRAQWPTPAAMLPSRRQMKRNSGRSLRTAAANNNIVSALRKMGGAEAVRFARRQGIQARVPDGARSVARKRAAVAAASYRSRADHLFAAGSTTRAEKMKARAAWLQTMADTKSTGKPKSMASSTKSKAQGATLRGKALRTAASELRIKGRSKMSAAQLREAVASARNRNPSVGSVQTRPQSSNQRNSVVNDLCRTTTSHHFRLVGRKK